MSEPNGDPAPPKALNALEEAKRSDRNDHEYLQMFMTLLFGHIPIIRELFDLRKQKLNYAPRHLYFNAPIPEAELDHKTGHPKVKYATNKVRTTKYTPLNFLPKNIAFQFQNVANIYFLVVAILSGFSIFGVNNAGLAAVPIIAIVAITAIRDAIEDWRRMLLDLEMNNTITVVLDNVENSNSPPGNISAWRHFKKRCSRFYRKTWYRMRGKQDPLTVTDVDKVDDNENASVRMSMGDAVFGRGSSSRASMGSSLRNRQFASTTEAADHLERQPQFRKKYWKDVKVGDFVKVYADEGVPADILVLSSSDPEGDCFIDTRNLDGETNLKPRRALQMTRTWRRGWHINKQKFELEVEGANSDLDSFGWTYRDVESGKSEALGPPNFIPRGATLRNTRWVIGYAVYTGEESKIRLNAGETPTKRSRISRELNIYVFFSFTFIFILCLVSGIVEGVKFRSKTNSAYFFEFGLTAGHPSVNGFVTFFAAMLVLQNMVPISLYISIEIVRTCLAFFIYSDTYMYDEVVDYPCTPKSWSLSDDLGQIEFIFSDKTGTLTQNSMVFRKCTVNGKSYGKAFTESMAGQVKRNFGNVETVRAKAEKEIEEERESMLMRLQDYYKNPYFNEDELELVSESVIADLEGQSGHEQRQRLEQFALVLALCNTVVTEYKEVKRPNRTSGDGIDDLPMPAPIMSSEVIGAPSRPSTSSARANRLSARSQAGRPSMSSVRSNRSQGMALARATTGNTTHTFRPSKAAAMDNMTLVLKAESPDESALVKTARDLGYTLVDDGKKHKVVDMRGTTHRFEVLETILFSSHRKRMSVVVRNEANRYFVLCKGADSVIEKCLSSDMRFTDLYKQTIEDLQKYGDEGLRTLMMAYRELDASYALDWAKRYGDAVASPDRDILCEQLAEELENDLTLLGGTGIEDQLQVEVPHTIELLSQAGIKFWMLTGDKVETAISIGFSCNLLNTSMELLIVKHPEELAGRLAAMGLEVNKKTMAEAGADHSPARGKYALVIDGVALAALVQSEVYRAQFALLGKKCRAVLCCRVSPSQKAAVVHIMKTAFDVTSLAIGDGANDVSMIQEADIGVGIVGVEGRQAAMSADYAMGQFRFLQRLVLVHGRYSYYRIAGMSANLLYENYMFSMTLFWYGIFNQFDESYLYDYTYLTLFNSIFVSLPPVIRGILDQDLPDHVLLANPQLYGEGILRKAWTIKKYFLVAIDGIYQSAVAFFFGYSVMFNATFYHRTGRDVAFRQGLGAYIVHTCVFVCNIYVLLCQYRWDWFSLLVFVVSCGLVFFWSGIYTVFVSSNFFYKTAPHVYSALTFWAYFLLSTVTALMPKFIVEATLAIWFPSDVDIIREEYNYPKQVEKQRRHEAEKAEKPYSPANSHHQVHDSHDTANTVVAADKVFHEDPPNQEQAGESDPELKFKESPKTKRKLFPKWKGLKE